MKCSIGIFAHNEEKNIARLVEGILNQETEKAEIEEVLVVASGCGDGTVGVAKAFEEKDNRVRVLVQKEREGKYSAVNLFLKEAKSDILVIESGDTLPEKDVVERLVSVFSDPKVGMAGARPVPLNDPETFMGFCAFLLWELHHRLSLLSPKTGEMVAFRRVLNKIPPTAVDEAYIESLVKKKGFKVVYVPEAVVYNKGPETVSDFLKQRRRIFAGHLHLRKTAGYEVSTMRPFRLIKDVVGMDLSLRQLFFVPGVMALEGVGRLLGWWDYKRGRDHVVWKMAETTRDLKL